MTSISGGSQVGGYRREVEHQKIGMPCNGCTRSCSRLHGLYPGGGFRRCPGLPGFLLSFTRGNRVRRTLHDEDQGLSRIESSPGWSETDGAVRDLFA